MPRDAGTTAHSQFSQEGLMKRLALLLALALCSATAFAAINLNTATKEELVALPGIGPAKAQAILDYRASHGAFKAIEEVKDVKGIGAKRFEKLKGELTVVGASVKPSARPAEQSAPQRMAKGTVTPAAKRDETMGAKP
jgi:competence protein ComEA